LLYIISLTRHHRNLCPGIAKDRFSPAFCYSCIGLGYNDEKVILIRKVYKKMKNKLVLF